MPTKPTLNTIISAERNKAANIEVILFILNLFLITFGSKVTTILWNFYNLLIIFMKRSIRYSPRSRHGTHA